jgi:DNA polymerase-3 subunit gamma/tau
MLSRAAANALLKTLEEPPDNLVFILATTEPEKLPPTILSRCQHFRFRRLSEAEIVSKLSRLCSERDTQADDDALRLVARAADGAMRDAESLLERLLTTGKHIVRDAVESALGLPPSERMQRLAEHLINRELKSLLEESSSLYHDGFAPSSLAEQLIKTLRDALFVQVTGNTGFTLQVAQDALLRLIHTLDDELEHFTRRDDLFALEVTLIKGINTLSGNSPAAAVVSAPADAAPPVPARALPDFDPHSRPAAAPIKSPAKSAPAAQAEAPTKTPSLSWHAVKRAASAQLKAFLNPAQDKIDGHSIHLLFDERHSFHFNQLKARVDELIALIREVYGEPFDLTIAGPGESLQKKG